MSSKKYVSKPFYIDAIQYNGDNLKEVMEFSGSQSVEHDYLKKLIYLVRYGEKMQLRLNDYVAKLNDGQIMGYKKEDFEMLYKELETMINIEYGN